MDKKIRAQLDIYNRIEKGKINFKKSPKERLTVNYIATRLENLDTLWGTFNTVHEFIISGVSDAEYEQLEYFTKDFYSKMEELYTEYKTELKEKIDSMQTKPQIVTRNEGEKIGVQLPKISIASFSGKYSEWTTFRDLFLSLIHNNGALQKVQKLHYLKSYLTGEAEQLVRHLPITSDNYSVCWDLLENRYNNKKYITNCILKRFFGQKNIVSENSSSLKELFDTTNECLNALKNVGINTENWDVIVIYILSSKLDNESRKQWEAKICDLNRDLPTLKQFLEFLEHRFRSLEFLNPKITRVTQSHHVVSNDNVKVSTPCSYCSDDSHKLGNCKKFANEPLSARRNFVQTSNFCFNCLGANHSVVTCRLPTRCRICKKKHHSLLHSNNVSPNNVQVPTQSNQSKNVVAATATASSESDQTNITTCFSNNKSQVLLATALVKAETNSGSFMTLRSLLDQGSQASFITESAVQLLGLKRITSRSVISGVGSDCNTSINSKHVVQIKLQSIHDPTFTINVKAHVLTKLTSFLPERQVSFQLWPNMPKMKLADPKFNVSNKIDLLLGAEVYCQIIAEGLVKGPNGSPIAQNSRLGWILSGKIPENSNVNCNNTIITLHTQVSNEEFDLKRFWEIESDNSLTNKPPRTPEEQRCEEIYNQTTTRDSSGRYVVKLPFKDEIPNDKLGNTLDIAVKRFLAQEKRLLKSPKLKDHYAKVIAEYLELGHMEKVPKEEIDKMERVYLPHQAVVRLDKTTSPVRVVFDASCQDRNGISLNNRLMVGPTLQPDLRHLVMRWRLHPICLVADIIKMYRQIMMAKDHVDFQRIVWRFSSEEILEHYRLLTVTFGTSSAPYVAVRTLHQIAFDEGKQYPLASERILNDFYMDDLLTGCESVQEGIQVYEEITKLLSKGGFKLQKWSSNNEALLKEISKEGEINSNLELKIDEIIKILGLTWNRRTDDFEYSVQLPPICEPVTKRKVISDIAKLFDPMGWIAPAIVKAKMFIQQLWLTGIGWDEELPAKLLKEWITYRGQLTALTRVRLPRWIGFNQNCVTLEIHGFSDASNDAIAAVVYARVVDESGAVSVALITCKTKVAPIKQVSIPRLELCAAVLLAKLLSEVAEVLKVPKTKLHAWTDSTIVLAWLSSHPSRWKTFVANRVSEILNIIDRDQWSHVSSTDNPADCASRGVNPSELEAIPLWKTGPNWLKKTNIEYGKRNENNTDLEEKKKTYHVTTEGEFELWTKFSSLQKLIRVIAFCRRFVSKARKSAEARTLPSWLTSAELSKAIQISIRACQAMYFAQEIKDLTTKEVVNKKSKLTTLTPFLDHENILRVGGRLEKANIHNDKKHPIVLPSKSHFTDLIIADAHKKTLHGGPQLMVNYLRSKYWILDIKNRTKLFVRKCVICERYAAHFRHQLMGQLPPARVTPIRPFYQSGVDYAGPIQIRTTKGRGHRSYKGYICLFICMATRAVHLEAVTDLTSQGFLAAFKRFVARRGHCADLYSDNGTNFVGAARELKTLVAQEHSTMVTEIAESLATTGTTWHFIPPRAPHFGGLWESGIKSVKHHLRRVIGAETLTYEEISTLLYQIEACLNSRPLSQISTSSQDSIPLTPGHFIIGEPLVLVPDDNYEASSISSLKRWQLTQKMLQNFWRRWSNEYLSQFLQRYKWANKSPEPQIGDVVLVKEDDLPPAKWLLGVIVEKHKGSDNVTRVVSLKCRGGIIKRPVVKLCVLPVAE